MSLVSDLLDILDTGEITLDASFRGIPFAILDSSDPPGRRLQKFLFPGLDEPAFQDLGQDDGEIRISGLLIGDDYIQQAEELRTAFQTPGPGTLEHPWLGSVEVLLIGKPDFSNRHDEILVTRFTATFARSYARQPPVFDTQESLLDQLNDLRKAAFALLQDALAIVGRVLSVVAQVRGFIASVVGFFDLAVLDISGITSELLGPATASSRDALRNGAILPLDSTFGTAVGALLAGPSAAALAAAQPPIPAAVAPGGDLAPPVAADPRIVATMLLRVAGQVAALPIDVAPAAALVLATRALILADAIATASDIEFTSQQDAAGWLATLSAALAELESEAQALGAIAPVMAGTVWRTAISSGSALAIDMNSRIGRLPKIIRITPAQRVPVWLLAQYLSGDKPSAVFATYLDLVGRNNILHPGLPVPGSVEALTPAAAQL